VRCRTAANTVDVDFDLNLNATLDFDVDEGQVPRGRDLDERAEWLQPRDLVGPS
jgi:hypothetical protein